MRLEDYPLPKVGDKLQFISGNIASIVKRDASGFYLKYVDIKDCRANISLDGRKFYWSDLQFFINTIRLEEYPLPRH